MKLYQIQPAKKIINVKSLKKRGKNVYREVPMTQRLLDALADYWAYVKITRSGSLLIPLHGFPRWPRRKESNLARPEEPDRQYPSPYPQAHLLYQARPTGQRRVHHQRTSWPRQDRHYRNLHPRFQELKRSRHRFDRSERLVGQAIPTPDPTSSGRHHARHVWWSTNPHRSQRRDRPNCRPRPEES